MFNGAKRAYESAIQNALIGFVDSILRGVGQVMFQNSPITGVLLLIGIFYNSWLFGIYAILGTVVSTLTGIALGAPRDMVRAGLFGFNGTLLGIAFAFFLQAEPFPQPVHLAYTVAGAIAVAVVMSALAYLLSVWEVPALTAPFVFTTWFFLSAFYYFSFLQNTAFIPPPALVSHVTEIGAVSINTLYEGLFKGVAEVFFQDNIITGMVFLVAILVNSRISFAFAVLGSIVGLLAALGLGAAETTLRLGLFGFSSVLTGIALGGVFYVVSWRSTLYAIFAIIVTAIMFASISVFLTPASVPALTAPFVVTTWFFLFAKRLFTQLHSVSPADAKTAEENLGAFRARITAARTDGGKDQRARS